jgi:hypothetical protein
MALASEHSELGDKNKNVTALTELKFRPSIPWLVILLTELYLLQNVQHTA